MSFQVDSAYLFEYDENESFRSAWDNQLVKNLETVRIYEESMRSWNIDLNSRVIKFGNYPPCQVVSSNDNELVYINCDGQICKLVLKETLDGKPIVFFLEPPKDGKVKGSFLYPQEIVHN
jgi:hypothetical protein